MLYNNIFLLTNALENKSKSMIHEKEFLLSFRYDSKNVHNY